MSTIPPELAALLASGGGGSQDASMGPGAPQAPTQDPAQDPANVPPQDGAPGGDPVQILKDMIDLGKKYLDVEPDEEDKATMADVLSRLQKYLAKDQADADAALGGKVSPKLMRKVGSGVSA